MPLPTPRGYPYSVPTDPADVPQAVEDLALAVDADVQARDESVHARPTFRLSSTSPISFYSSVPGPQNRALPFEVEDVSVGGAVAPLSGFSQTRITPLLPGFWWFQAAMVFPRSGALNMSMIGLTLQTQSQVLSRNSTHLAPPVSDGSNSISCSGGTYMNGTTDYVQLVGLAQTTVAVVGSPSLVVRRRYLLAMRMTEA